MNNPGHKAKGQRQVHSKQGFAYLHAGPGDPMRDADKHWTVSSIESLPAQVLGKRKLEGAGEVVVFRAGDRVYAQTALEVR